MSSNFTLNIVFIGSKSIEAAKKQHLSDMAIKNLIEDKNWRMAVLGLRLIAAIRTNLYNKNQKLTNNISANQDTARTIFFNDRFRDRFFFYNQ